MPKKNPIQDYKADADIVQVAEDTVDTLIADLDSDAGELTFDEIVSPSTALEMKTGAETLKQYK